MYSKVKAIFSDDLPSPNNPKQRPVATAISNISMLVARNQSQCGAFIASYSGHAHPDPVSRRSAAVQTPFLTAG